MCLLGKKIKKKEGGNILFIFGEFINLFGVKIYICELDNKEKLLNEDIILKEYEVI